MEAASMEVQHGESSNNETEDGSVPDASAISTKTQEVFKLPMPIATSKKTVEPSPERTQPNDSQNKTTCTQSQSSSDTTTKENVGRPTDKSIPISEDKKNDEKKENDSNSIGSKAELTLKAEPPKYPEIPYSEPSWGAKSKEHHFLEVIKGGCVVKNIALDKKSFFVAGRLENCDIKLDHPSSSRYHAVLQYKGTLDDSQGFYLYDLASTHGTFINKVQIKPRKYFRLRVGFVIKFGGSSRMYILQGPEDEQEAEEYEISHGIDPSSTVSSNDDNKREKDVQDEKDDTDDGIDWGMGEDAVEEETDIEKLIEKRKPLELKDPKKTLRGFFEREGLELEYEADEKGSGPSKSYIIRVRLPIETPTGEDLYAEASASKKKEAVLSCAVRACQILDAHDMLRTAEHESVRAKRAKMMEENDYYDSDEDNFLDRTGSVEKKRKMRMQKAGKVDKTSVDSYESLTKKAEEIQKQMDKVIHRIDDLKSELNDVDDDDELEAYMNAMNTKIKKDAIKQAEKELQKLNKEKSEIDRLIEICKPTLAPILPRKEHPAPTVERGSTLKGKSELTPTAPEERKIIEKNGNKIVSEQRIIKDSDTDGPQPQCGSNEDKKSVIAPSENFVGTSDTVSFAVPATVIQKKKKKKKVYGAPTMQQATADTRFSDWTPPEGQTGDGYTKLNEKYGY